MSPPRRRGLRRIGYAVIAVVLAATMATGAHVAHADTNRSAKRLVVHDNNIENMAGCAGNNFDHLVDYLKKQDKSPDIFTVQQISNQKQLNTLVKRLTAELPGVYAGKIAIADPGSMGYTSGCKTKKNQQTNAIIYRSGRLEARKSTTWRSDAPAQPKKGTGNCKNLEPTATSQDRVVNLAVKFYDKVADHYVSVASVHWPTKKWHGPDCADENLRETNAAIENLGGAALKIIAGDTNATTPSQDWWQKARDLGYRDPIAEKCGARVCSDRYNTIGKRRIDHILVKSGHGFGHVDNITESMAGGKYSDHRALIAYVKY